jgi:hypothetical protein
MVRVTVKMEDAIVVPTTAVQVSPTGTYVYVVEDNIASSGRWKWRGRPPTKWSYDPVCLAANLLSRTATSCSPIERP